MKGGDDEGRWSLRLVQSDDVETLPWQEEGVGEAWTELPENILLKSTLDLTLDSTGFSTRS